MTTPGLSQRFVTMLAGLCHDTRAALEVTPPWDEAGIAYEIRRHAHVRPDALAIAFIRGATDPQNTTPAALSQDANRAWDAQHAWRCRVHPETRARRLNGECGACYADRHEDPDAVARFVRQPVPDAALALAGRGTSPERASPTGRPEREEQPRPEEAHS